MSLFSLLIGIGSSLGLLQVARRVPDKQALRWTAAGLGVLAAGLLGARLNYALLHPNLFRAAPLDMLRFWLGGLSWPGALLLSLLSLAAFSLALRAPLGLAVDVLAPLFPTVAVTAWLACNQAGCAYGVEIPAESAWALRLPDENGLLASRWPLQLSAAASLLLLTWRVERGSAGTFKLPGGQACSLGLALGLHTLLFSWLRADNPLTWRGLRLDLAAAGGLAGLCLLGLVWLGLRQLRTAYAEKSSARREAWPSSRDQRAG